MDLEGKREGSVHSTGFRPARQGQLRAVGQQRGRQLFSGWDRLEYCSVLTRQKWKMSSKSWQYWGKETRAFLLVGGRRESGN